MIYELLKDEQHVQYFDSLRSAVNHAGFRSEHVVRTMGNGVGINGWRINKIKPGRIEFARRWALTKNMTKVAMEIRRFTVQEAVDFFLLSETTLRRYAAEGRSPGDGWRFIHGEEWPPVFHWIAVPNSERGHDPRRES